MNLFQSESDRYTQEQLSAREAQRLAEYIAWGPVIFQVSRLMVKWGILDALRDSLEGLTLDELVRQTQFSKYALKVLLEASLSAGTVLVNKDTDRYTISKTGWFLLNDPATRVNIDFNHDVNYRGMFFLDEALKEGSQQDSKPLATGQQSMKDCQNLISKCRTAGLALTISIVTIPLTRRWRLCSVNILST